MSNLSHDFNLNIDNYNEEEIEQLFDLQYPYSSDQIAQSQNIIKDKLLNDKNLGEDKQHQIVDFLKNCGQKLQKKSGTSSSFMENKNEIIQQGGNIIIKRHDEAEAINATPASGRVVDSMQAPPGILNPINYKSIVRAVTIDSRFRPNYYDTKSTNYLVTLPTTLKKVLSLRIASIDLPMTYYAISRAQGNNTFVVRDINGSGPLLHTCVLPDGNYEVSFSNTTHAFHIETAINKAMVAAGVDVNLVYTVDPISGRSVFASQAEAAPLITSFVIDFNVDHDGNIDQTRNLQFTLGWQLGFRTATYVADGDGVGAAAIVSEGICYPIGPRYAYLGLTDFNNNSNNYFISAFASSILNPDIIARINLIKMQQNEGIYHAGDDEGSSTQLNRTRNYFGPVDIQKLKITLYDEFGRIIDLNNMDWSFTIKAECLYD
jgi:hypothetical protein